MTLYLIDFGSTEVVKANPSPAFQTLQGSIIVLALMAGMAFRWVRFNRRCTGN